MEILSKSEQETEAAGERLAKTLRPGDVIALYGGLGAGKTVFVRGLARGLGIACRVTSPTFALVNEYPGPVRLYHFDMYRLAGADELYDIGFEDYLDGRAVCAVEWAENGESALPPDAVRVEILPEGEGTRRITITGGRPA